MIIILSILSILIGNIIQIHGENFGVALAESLGCGKPVLTTFKVNIYKEILHYKCGLISKNKIDSFEKILLELKNLKT